MRSKLTAGIPQITASTARRCTARCARSSGETPCANDTDAMNAAAAKRTERGERGAGFQPAFVKTGDETSALLLKFMTRVPDGRGVIAKAAFALFVSGGCRSILLRDQSLSGFCFAFVSLIRSSTLLRTPSMLKLAGGWLGGYATNVSRNAAAFSCPFTRR